MYEKDGGVMFNKYGKIENLINESDYYEFFDKDDCNTWGKALDGKWAEEYKILQKRAERTKRYLLDCGWSVDFYAGNKFREMNEILRSEQESEWGYGYNVSLIRELYFQIIRAPQIGEKIVAYRYVCKEMIEEMISNNKKGKVYQEKGFLSTSLIKKACIANKMEYQSDFLLKIYIPENVYGVYVNLIAQRSEMELLLAPEYFLKMIKKPYWDEEAKAEVYEVELVSFDLEE